MIQIRAEAEELEENFDISFGLMYQIIKGLACDTCFQVLMGVLLTLTLTLTLTQVLMGVLLTLTLTQVLMGVLSLAIIALLVTQYLLV